MNINNKSIVEIKDLLILLPYFFSFSLLLFFDNGSKTLVPIVILSVFVILATEKNIQKIIINNITSPLFFALSIYTAHAIFSYYYYGFSSNQLRALICLVVLFTFFPLDRLNLKLINNFICLGIFTAFINNIYHNVYLDDNRWAGPINPIPYATICAVFFIFCLSIFISSKNKIQKKLSLLFLSLSSISIILTQTRGVWLAISISSLLLIIINIKKIRLGKINLTLTIAIFFIAALIFKDDIGKRVTQTKQEIAIIYNGDLNTSIGLRIQMWLATNDYIDDAYILGIGSSLHSRTEKLYSEQKINYSLYSFSPTHLHNQYLDKLIKYGIVGLSLLVILLIAPYYNLRKRSQPNRNIIIGITSIYFFSGLTDVPFNHPQSLLIYILLLLPIMQLQQRAIVI